MTTTPTTYRRCQSGAACIEVVARVAAAERTRRAGLDAIADELAEAARRWALVHHYGQTDEPET